MRAAVSGGGRRQLWPDQVLSVHKAGATPSKLATLVLLVLGGRNAAFLRDVALKGEAQ
jgi:hypothetical protein